MVDSGLSIAKVNFWIAQLKAVNALEDPFQKLTEPELRQGRLIIALSQRVVRHSISLLPETYALIREGGRHALRMRHYDVQIIGGIAQFYGCIAEMQTGEGKTLTATLPLALHSLVGKGAHLATVNDYLAKRDAEWMQPLYDLLGFKVGTILTESTSDHTAMGTRPTSPMVRPKSSGSTSFAIV